VYYYDRRGRGESGDTKPFALDREIEDIEAVIDAAGGLACVYGVSSGAALVFEAALKLGNKIKKIAMYEAPYNDDPQARQNWVNYRKKIDALIAQGRNGDALIAFMMLVGMEEEHVEGMRQMPFFESMAAVAPTLIYDAEALGPESAVPSARAGNISMPTLVMAGSASYPFMDVAAQDLAKKIPKGKYRVIEGQTHEVDPAVIAPVLTEFFNAN
jgi:pimeloyl-ACP methyl ester carboxylesterase